MFCAVLTARVIFMAKTGLDISSLRREQVWTFSVLDDQIYEMRCLFVAALRTQCPLYSAASLGYNVIGPHANPPSHIILTPG